MATMAEEVDIVYGEDAERTWDRPEETARRASPILNTVFTKIAGIFVDSGLGTEEEAYLSIIPPLFDKRSAEVRAGINRFILLFFEQEAIEVTDIIT